MSPELFSEVVKFSAARSARAYWPYAVKHVDKDTGRREQPTLSPTGRWPSTMGAPEMQFVVTKRRTPTPDLKRVMDIDFSEVERRVFARLAAS